MKRLLTILTLALLCVATASACFKERDIHKLVEMRGDTAVLNLDNGTYYLHKPLYIRSSLIIRGKKNTKIVFDAPKQKPGSGAWDAPYYDDAFIAVYGMPEMKPKVVIENVSFEAKNLQNLPKENGEYLERLYIKLINSDSVVCRNSNFRLTDGYPITNIDMRDCSNITVTDCNFLNYNYIHQRNGITAGGCLWVRGNVENVLVRNNTFRKYGNDEILAFFSPKENYKALGGSVIKRNIVIDDNDFFYQAPSKKLVEEVDNHVFIKITDHTGIEADPDDPCTYELKDISIRNNRVTLANPCLTVFSLYMNGKAKASNVVFENNTVVSTFRDCKKIAKVYSIIGYGESSGSVELRNNHSHLDVTFADDRSDIPYIGIEVKNMTVNLNGNEWDFGENPSFGGVMYDVNGARNAEINATDEQVRNLKNLASLSKSTYLDGSEVPFESVKLNLRNSNYEGQTLIYCNALQHIDAQIKGCHFGATNPCFLFINFAKEGSLIFSDNEVEKRWNGSGDAATLFYSETPAQFHFQKAEIQRNNFQWQSAKPIEQPITAVRHGVIKSEGNNYDEKDNSKY